MIEYYARRAAEYEDIYRKPERQPDLIRLAQTLAAAFPGMDVLEVACGTGYWTQHLAKSARRIVASDVNDEVLEIARRKDYGQCCVSFHKADAYALSESGGHTPYLRVMEKLDNTLFRGIGHRSRCPTSRMIAGGGIE